MTERSPRRSQSARSKVHGEAVERIVDGWHLHQSYRRDGGLCVFIERLSGRFGRGGFRVLYEADAPAACPAVGVAPVPPGQSRLEVFA